MKIYYGYDAVTEPLTRPIITIGNFDGVHHGHRQLLRKVIQQARADHGTAVVFTFKPHPQIALNPDKQHELLTLYEERAELLQQLGVDVLIEQPFSRDFSQISPQDFFGDVLLKRLSARRMIIGHDFGFGRNRSGHIDLLRQLCTAASVPLEVIEPFGNQDRSMIYSSSAVRTALRKGDLNLSQQLLGYHFFYQGIVTKGAQRGRQLGFPTANLLISQQGQKIILPFGVYASWAEVGKQKFRSITNLGIRPTFVTQSQSEDHLKPAVLAECHLLDMQEDLYGQSVRISFLRKIRDEKKFSSPDELKRQIAADIQSLQSISWQS